MTVETRALTPRIAVALAVLAAAAFVYVTAEIAPVGALPAIAADLGVSEAVVGTLLATYAAVAAVATVPLVRATAHWPRRRVLLLTLVSLTVAQIISALAPTFAVLAGGRALSALTHGLMWSVLAPIGARLVPPDYAGRATTAVYVGTGLALVVGSPLTAAMSQLCGWRTVFVAIAIAAGLVTLAARVALPPLPSAIVRGEAGERVRHHRNPRLVVLSVLTLIGVTGHFISYTFIVVIIRDVVGVHGPALGWLLAVYGVAGLGAMALLARPTDRRPRETVLGCLATLALAFIGLAALASVDEHRSWSLTLFGAAAVVLWGAMATALPPMMQSAAMRSSPEDPDGASGLYVVAFQVGIMAGALVGGLIYQRAGVPTMIGMSAALLTAAWVGVVADRRLFVPPQSTPST